MSSARFALVYYHPYFSLHVMRHSVVCLPQLQSTVPVVGIASERAFVVYYMFVSASKVHRRKRDGRFGCPFPLMAMRYIPAALERWSFGTVSKLDAQIVLADSCYSTTGMYFCGQKQVRRIVAVRVLIFFIVIVVGVA